MKTWSEQAVAQLEGRKPIIAGAGKLMFSPDPVLAWSGLGPIEIESEVYAGIGSAALIAPISSSVGGAADGLKITVSGLDPALAQAVEESDYHQKPATIRRMVFAPDGFTLLDSRVYMRGRIDTIARRWTQGGTATIEIAIEGPRRDMNRAGSRIRSDTDQRVLGGANSGAFKHIAIMARKMLNWGGSPTTVGGGAIGGPKTPNALIGWLGRK